MKKTSGGRAYFFRAAAAAASLFCAGVLAAQSRGLTISGNDGSTLARFSASHALVIGESAYSGGWPSLPGVRGDTSAVKKLLEEQGFSVELVENAGSRDLRNGIEAFFTRYGYDRDARLAIYYAGHGHTLKLDNTRDMGYIVPVDAPVPSRDETGFKRLAIPMQQFDTWARTIESRHVLFLFDSCFSGSIFATSRAAPGIIDYKTASPVRQFISSGGANETVPDVSIFRRQLEAALRDREADHNGDGYVSGSELGDFLQTRVVNYSGNSQHPQYGKIRDPDLDKGDFVFAVGRAAAVTAAPVQAPALEVGQITVATGSLEITTVTAGTVEIRGAGVNQKTELPAYGTLPIPRIAAGSYTVKMSYSGGRTEEKTVEIGRSEAKKLEFTYRPAPAPAPVPAARPASTPTPAPAAVRPAPTPERPVPDGMVRIQGGAFTMGSPASEPGRDSGEVQHQVTVASFYMGKYEVTQREYAALMGNNPSNFKGDTLPVE
ncbi:MAG: caspase family protein, partial [Treponema sp.]|nr:caspase family protein [Treponema sp.]